MTRPVRRSGGLCHNGHDQEPSGQHLLQATDKLIHLGNSLEEEPVAHPPSQSFQDRGHRGHTGGP